MLRMILILKKSEGIDIKNSIYFLDKDTVSIGRDAGSDIVLNDLYISRSHASLSKIKNKWYLRDLKSKNGTILNGNRIEDTDTFLSRGDIINFANKAEFIFEHESVVADETRTFSAAVSPYGIAVNEKTEDVYVDNVRIVPKLSPKEYCFLLALLKEPDRIHKYSELYSVVYSERPQRDSCYYDPDDVQKSIYIVANSLRKALKKQNITRKVFQARNKVGYQLLRRDEQDDVNCSE